MSKASELDISKRNNVSTNTVNRILHQISQDKLIKHNGHLPLSFGIDEFKATKDTVSKMAFIIVDKLRKIFLIFKIVENFMTGVSIDI